MARTVGLTFAKDTKPKSKPTPKDTKPKSKPTPKDTKPKEQDKN